MPGEPGGRDWPRGGQRRRAAMTAAVLEGMLARKLITG